MHYLLCGSYGDSENRKRSASASLSIVSIMIFLYGAPKGTKSQKTRILGQIPGMANFDPLSPRKVLSRQNTRKLCLQLNLPYFSAHYGVFRFALIWHIFLKICAIWVQISIHHNVRKNTEDRAISKVFSYFDEKVPFGVIMSQNWPYLAQNTCFLRFCAFGCIPQKMYPMRIY